MRPSWLAVIITVAASAGCRKSPPRVDGRIVVALTVDWEGAYLSPEGLDEIAALRLELPDAAPLTHFVSAAYFTKQEPDPTALSTLVETILPGDELAVHLHAWKSLAVASGLAPKLSPSFLSGTDQLLEFEDGDIGFDTDLDAYDVAGLRAMLRHSRRLLEQTRAPVSRSFRAGGYLGTPKVMQAIREEGYVVDSSATDYRQLDERNDRLPTRIRAIWPDVQTTTQPFVLESGGPLLEMPIAAFADYASADEIAEIFSSAATRLNQTPGRDVFIVLGFHQETAAEFARRLRDGLASVRARPELAQKLVFTTIEQASHRARTSATPPP